VLNLLFGVLGIMYLWSFVTGEEWYFLMFGVRGSL
jgi:hypothetical protein